MITFHLFLLGGWGGAVDECLVFLIGLVVKLLTGFEALVPPLKEFTLGVSVVILDGASIVEMLKGVEVSTVQYVISTFCAVYQVDLVCDTCRADSLKASTKETRGNDIHRRVGQSINCHAEKLARFLVSR